MPTLEDQQYDAPELSGEEVDRRFDEQMGGEFPGGLGDAPDVSPTDHAGSGGAKGKGKAGKSSPGGKGKSSPQKAEGVGKAAAGKGAKGAAGIGSMGKGGMAGGLGGANPAGKALDHLDKDKSGTEKAVDKAAGKAAGMAANAVAPGSGQVVGKVVEKVGTKRILIVVGVLILLPILWVMLTVMMLYQFIKNPIKAIWDGNPVVAAVKALILEDHGESHKFAYEVDLKDFKDFPAPGAIAAPAAEAPKEGTLEWKYSQIDWEKAKYQTIDQPTGCRVDTKKVLNPVSGKERSVIDKVYMANNQDDSMSENSKAICLSKVYPIFNTMMRSRFLREGLNKEIGLRYNYAEQDENGEAPDIYASPSPSASPASAPTTQSKWSVGMAYLKQIFIDDPIRGLKQKITAFAVPATSPAAETDPYEKLKERLRNKTLDRIWMRDTGQVNQPAGDVSLDGVSVPPGLANFPEGAALFKKIFAWVSAKTGVPTAMLASQAYQESSNYWVGQYQDDNYVLQHSYMIPGAGKQPIDKAKGDTGCTAGCQGPMQLDKYPPMSGNYNQKRLDEFKKVFGIDFPEHGEMYFDTAVGFAAIMAQEKAGTQGDPAATNAFYQSKENRVAFFNMYGTKSAGDKHYDEFNQGATSMRRPSQNDGSIAATFAAITPSAVSPEFILTAIPGGIDHVPSQEEISRSYYSSLSSRIGNIIAAQTTYYNLKKNYDDTKARAQAPCVNNNTDACVESNMNAQANYYKASKAVIDTYEKRYENNFGVSDGATIAQYHNALYAMRESIESCFKSTSCSTSSEYLNLVARAGAFANDLLSMEAARLGISGGGGGGGGGAGGSSTSPTSPEKPKDPLTKMVELPKTCDKDFDSKNAGLKSSMPIDYSVIKVVNSLLCGDDPQNIKLDDDIAKNIRSVGENGSSKNMADVICRYSLYLIESAKATPLDRLKLTQKTRIASMANAGFSHVTYADTQVKRPLLLDEMKADFYKMSNFAGAATYHQTAYGTENGTAPQAETLSGSALGMDMLGVHPEYPIQKSVRQLAGNCSDYLGNNSVVGDNGKASEPKKDESSTKISQIGEFYPQLKEQMQAMPFYNSSEFINEKKSFVEGTAAQKGTDKIGNAISDATRESVDKYGVGLDDVLLAFAKAGTNVSDSGTEDGPQNFNRMHAGVQAYMYAYNLAMGGNLISQDRAVAEDIKIEEAVRDQEKRRGLAYRLFNTDNPRSLASHLGTALIASPLQSAKNVASVFGDLFSPLRNMSSASGSLGYYLTGNNNSAIADNSFSYNFLKLEPSTIPDSIITSNPIENGKYIEHLKESTDGDKHVKIGVFYVPYGAEKQVDPHKGDHTIKEWFGIWDKCFATFIPGELALDDDPVRECQPVMGVDADLDTSEGGKLALAYKTYHYNNLVADAMLYLSDPSKVDENLYASSSQGGGAGAGGANAGGIVGDPFTSSVDVACFAGTKDVGVQEGYHDGTAVQIRLCAIPNFPSSSAESQPGSEYYVEGADGNSLVTSRVSGAVLSMVNDSASSGTPLAANSSFRTMAHQTGLYNKPHSNPVARPGYSNHQMGAAIDFANCSRGSATFNWLVANADKYGYKNLPSESWHWSPNGR